MYTFAMIADDLTGASDSGVQFAQRGLSTAVFFEGEGLMKQARDIEVPVIDTDSRGILAEHAYKRVNEIAKQLLAVGCQHVYKKMDSTLRGNIGAEVDGVLDGLPVDFAVIVPAYPQIGRTTSGGIHYLHGTPIHQTEVGKDPKTPVTQSNLPALLMEQSRRKAVSIPVEQLAEFAESEASLIEALHHYKQAGIELLVFDATEAAHLQQIARLMHESHFSLVWVGAAGLAEAVADALELVGDHHRCQSETATGAIFTVSGSLSSVTGEQIEQLASQPTVGRVTLQAEVALADEVTRVHEIERCISELEAYYQKGLDLVLHSPSDRVTLGRIRALSDQAGVAASEVAQRIAAMLGTIAASVVEALALRGVILTGGDTAKAISKQLGVQGIRLVEELEPGIPLGQLIGPYSLSAVTKAGAFGTDQSLVHAYKRLKGV